LKATRYFSDRVCFRRICFQCIIEEAEDYVVKDSFKSCYLQIKNALEKSHLEAESINNQDKKLLKMWDHTIGPTDATMGK
jgi:hypothetical protein